MLKIDLENRKTYDTNEITVQKIGEINEFCAFRPDTWKTVGWRRCVQGPDGTVYFQKGMASRDGGLTVEKNDHILNGIDLLPETCYISEPGFFYMVVSYPEQIGEGKLQARAVWSHDSMATLEKGLSTIELPGLGKRIIAKDGWDSCYFFGSHNILRLSDGRLLATMYGSFEDDNAFTQDVSAITETRYKKSAFVVISDDNGSNWRYYSMTGKTLAMDPLGEGFNESTIARIRTGELMCVMRTGHFYPLYCSWSADEGKTWTDPFYMGLEHACAPCLLAMSDGKLALAYGQRFPAGTTPRRFNDELDSCMFHNQVKLAVSADGRGRQWIDMTIGYDLGTTYVTLLEVGPNVILCQTDGWCWRVELEP